MKPYMTHEEVPQLNEELYLAEQPTHSEEIQSNTPLDLDFRFVTRSLSQIAAHERPLRPIRKEPEIRQKIRKAPVLRRAAGDPTVSIRQVSNRRQR